MSVPGADVTKPAAGGGHDVEGDGVVGDGVVAVARATADGVPVLVGTRGMVGVLVAAGITEQALSTSTDASAVHQDDDGPIRIETR